VTVSATGSASHSDYLPSCQSPGRRHYTYPGLTLIQGSGRVTCNGDCSSAPFVYYFDGSPRLITDTNPGRPWNRRLTGAGAYGRDSLRWTLTAR
jgi:hypothetical protein